MSRALAVFAACLVVLSARGAGADAIDKNVAELSGGGSYKERLAAALALAKTKDARAVIAIADALDKDEEPTIRRVAALALEKMIDAHTPEDARALGFAALDHAATTDGDSKVKDTAKKALKALAGLRPSKKPAATVNRGDKPEVFVNIDTTTDQSKRAPSDAPDRITKVVKKSIERTGYATSWPGGLPTSSELASSRSRAFIVASTVKKIETSRVGHQTEIACTVAIRVAPWSGKDGGEKWEASKAASASGSAKATTGNSEREVSSGVKDCLEAVSEDVTSRQVLPFLKHLATTSM
jgi:HEAT repeat protein